MKTLIQLIAVALIFGGGAATYTIVTQKPTAPAVAAAVEGAPAQPATAANKAPEEQPADTPDHDATAEYPDLTESADKALPSEENPMAAADPPRSQPVLPEAPVLDSATSRPEARVAVRPPYTPEGDEAGGLINLLRERSRIATETERKLAERQDAMQLIFEDLRAEQARTLKIRQRLSGELKQSRDAVDTALLALDAERSQMQKSQAESRHATEEALRVANEERDKLRKQLEKATTPPAADEVRSNNTAGSPEENVNLKKMATVFDSMPAENVAKVFEQLVKNKRTEAVVALMNAMKDRQAAKVLGLITETNPSLAADLTDRLKRLKSTVEKRPSE